MWELYFSHRLKEAIDSITKKIYLMYPGLWAIFALNSILLTYLLTIFTSLESDSLLFFVPCFALNGLSIVISKLLMIFSNYPVHRISESLFELFCTSLSVPHGDLKQMNGPLSTLLAWCGLESEQGEVQSQNENREIWIRPNMEMKTQHQTEFESSKLEE